MKYDLKVEIKNAKYYDKKVLILQYTYESGKEFTRRIYLSKEELANLKIAVADIKI